MAGCGQLDVEMGIVFSFVCWGEAIGNKGLLSIMYLIPLCISPPPQLTQSSVNFVVIPWKRFLKFYHHHVLIIRPPTPQGRDFSVSIFFYRIHFSMLPFFVILWSRFFKVLPSSCTNNDPPSLPWIPHQHFCSYKKVGSFWDTPPTHTRDCVERNRSGVLFMKHELYRSHKYTA